LRPSIWGPAEKLEDSLEGGQLRCSLLLLLLLLLLLAVCSTRCLDHSS
jgi:hypothetical protein